MSDRPDDGAVSQPIPGETRSPETLSANAISSEALDRLRAANEQWLEEQVRPAFQMFAARARIRGYDPVLTSTATGCWIRVIGPKYETFQAHACVGGLESEELDILIPRGDWAVRSRRRDEISAPLLLATLFRAFGDWCAKMS